MKTAEIKSPSSPEEYNLFQDPIYMSSQMLSYFTAKLKDLQHQILHREEDISFSVAHNSPREPDHVDRGIMEEYNFNQLSFEGQQENLLQEVQEALKRIEEGKYGYCQETGEAIGLRRLEAVPYARYCIDIQSQKEREQR